MKYKKCVIILLLVPLVLFSAAYLCLMGGSLWVFGALLPAKQCR